MSEKVVKVIPLKKEVKPEVKIKKIKVAGYARVSTDNDEQTNSYNSQVEYYTNYIKKNPEWEFVGLYSDVGVSGVMTKGRTGFNKMIADAESGKIDLIITKSISRFARNTVDSLQTIRELKNHKVEVFFEKENIKTFDTKGELMLSILASLAQDESRSISENVQWAIKRRFAQGHARFRGVNFLGYKRDNNGVVVDNNTASAVKKIYRWFLDGHSYATINQRLMDEHIKTPSGLTNWRPHIVKSILTNEKYCGDALCQKYYTVDFMNKKRAKNEGAVQQYYIENNHEGIIPRDIFDIVQNEIKRRSGKHISRDIIANKTFCGYCGTRFNKNVRYAKGNKTLYFYTCLNRVEHGCFCRIIYQDALEKMFIEAVNNIVTNKAEIINEIESEIRKATKISDLKERKENQEKRLTEIVDKLNKYIYRATKLKDIPEADKVEYRENYIEYTKASKTTKRLTKEYTDAVLRQEKLTMFFDSIKEQDLITEFSIDLWGKLIDKFIVYNDKVVIKFYGEHEYVIADFEKYPRMKEVPVPSTYQINRLNERIENKESVNKESVNKESVNNESVNIAVTVN